MVPGDDADRGDDGYSRVTAVITDNDDGGDDAETGIHVKVVPVDGEMQSFTTDALVTSLQVVVVVEVVHIELLILLVMPVVAMVVAVVVVVVFELL